MTDRNLVLFGRVIAMVTVACGFLTVIVLTRSGAAIGSTASLLQQLSGTLIVPAVVLIALPKVPRNGSVWAFAVVGLSLGLVALGDAVAWSASGITSEAVNDLTVMVAPADLPLAASLGLSVALSVWIPSFVLLPTLVLLLFPDGRFPDPQRVWRRVGTFTMVVTAVGIVATFWQYPVTSTKSYTELTDGTSLASLISGVATSLFVLLVIVSIVGYGLKWKRAKGEVRLQYRWVGFAFFMFSIWSVATIVLGPIIDSSGGKVGDVVSWVMIIFIPLAYAVSIMKYRLYDIDVVISRTITYGVLAAFITGVYALLVVGIGSLVGRVDEPNLALSIGAVAIVAVAFEPLRGRVQHWANVLVYGKRATPYEVLASATARLADTSDPDRALGEITQLVVDGTGASVVVLWLTVGGVLHARASSPVGVIEGLVPVGAGEDLADVPGDRVVAIRHRGEVLGALSITKERGESVTGADEKVLADVGAGAGVLLRNIGLNAELVERADQLRASRRRLVAAHDAERHRLERDLHDGAQQQVVALKVKLGIARTLAEREGADKVAVLVASLSETTQEAVDGMRAVAHGIYPPLLEAEGLEAALGAAKRTVPVPVEVVVDDLGRYERSVEEGVYFAVLGILAQAVDAGATRAIISLTGGEDVIRFGVDVDAAPGDLVSVTDRIDALDGTIDVTSERDVSVVSGELPARIPPTTLADVSSMAQPTHVEVLIEGVSA